MKLVIPSHNRFSNVITLDIIPKKYLKDTYIVVRDEEQQSLYSHYDCNVLVLDCNSIATKRDAICRHFAGEKIWMIDDDCLLYNAELVEYVNHLGKTHTNIKPTTPVTEEDFDEFIDYVSNLLDKYPHGAVRPHIFVRNKNYLPYRLNTWAFTNVLLNLSIIDADFLDYTFVEHSEDLVAFLNVIESEYDNFCLSKWLIKTKKPGNPGGMTDIRNAEMITNAHIKINKKFPKHTKLKEGYEIDGHRPQTLRVRPKKRLTSYSQCDRIALDYDRRNL